jgi:transcription elongation factor GreB
MSCGGWSAPKSQKKCPGLRASVIAVKTPIINKKRLREIDRRVRYLRKSLENLKVIDYHPQQDGKVFFGAWVEVENDAGDTLKFRIVGYDEIFNRKDYISIDSPMARALLKKEVDDEAVVTTEAGTVTWYINSIEYERN